MRTSILLAAMAVASMATSAGVSAAPPSAPVAPTINPGFCKQVFSDALDSGANPLVQLFDNEDKAGLTGDLRKAQTGMCIVYFQGMMDYIAMTSPTT